MKFYPEVFPKRQCDSTCDGVGESKPVFWVNKIDETSAIPHVTRVTQNLGYCTSCAHHHA